MKKSICIKNAFALLFAVIIICGFISTGLVSLAATPVQLAVTSASGKAGDDVTVSINVSENSGIAAADILVTYDTTKLTHVSSKAGTAASGGMSSINPNYAVNGNFASIKDSYIHISGVMAGGSMLNITFTIKQAWTGSTPIKLAIQGEKIYDKDFKEITYTISNGSVSIGTTSQPTTTTTSPSTTPATTKPASTVPATTESSTTPGAETTVVSTTAVPVTVPVEEIIDVLGPDVKDWDKDYEKLDKEQKEKIKEHFADNGKPVEITPDGVYYIETTVPDTTGDISSTGSEGDTDTAQESGMTSGRKIFFTLAIVCAILSIAFCVAYISRKKGRKV